LRRFISRSQPANDTLRYPNSTDSAQRPQAIYRMIARYRSEGGSSQYSLRLNSLQVRPNSERVSLEGRILERDKDYTIEYELGTVTFTRGDTLFPRPRQVNVRYEENPLFASAPITILGFASQFPLENGQLSFTAISQQQRSGLNRPPLGFEPIGSLVAGVTGSMAWDATLLSSLVRKLPFNSGNTRSRLALQGEFAMSKPRPNAAGRPTSNRSKGCRRGTSRSRKRRGTGAARLWVALPSLIGADPQPQSRRHVGVPE
jgi:cell surface protein SprA